MIVPHRHPCSFRLVRTLDRGWGELACEYAWEMAAAQPCAASRATLGASNVEPARCAISGPFINAAHRVQHGQGWHDSSAPAFCFLFEHTVYDCADSAMDGSWLLPPDPPFRGWRLRNPTDGRTGPVGLERFDAAIGHAWDRHKLAGPLVGEGLREAVTIRATQQYRFHCEICGADSPIAGPAAGPHQIVRTLRPVAGADGRSRFDIEKHGVTAWIEFAGGRYVADSVGIGFGPAWCAAGPESDA
ncbi:MAG TPA: hypothetical protein VKT77_15450 [Chthonomonadaceae bacterium]|nr:hypothetical protein [Chthonomonadaceae bacterium]